MSAFECQHKCTLARAACANNTYFAGFEVEGFVFACALENARDAVAHHANAVAYTETAREREREMCEIGFHFANFS